MSEQKQQKEFTCDTCDLEFSRDKDYFSEGEDIECYCCIEQTHYVDLYDIRKDHLQETEEGEDFGNLTDEIILSTQLRLGPLRRKLDYWKFRTQGGYSQGVIGTGASADVDAPVAGAITSFSNLVGGTGYVNHPGLSIGAPRVVFDNTGTDGTGAKADITITAGVVTAITVTDGGSGYTSAPTIIITGSGEPGGTESGTGKFSSNSFIRSL